MITARTKSNRLPGIRFEAQAPARDEILPRMDIAVFVGFAAAGPVNIPVVVESSAHFAWVFGADLPLVADKQTGKTVFAYLAPAVRQFFNNGGVRCWIVRVARNAVDNRFPIQGLAKINFDEAGNPIISKAFARARAPGGWSDDLQTASSLLVRAVKFSRLVRADETAAIVEIEVDQSDFRSRGELLRVRFLDENKRAALFLIVDETQVNRQTSAGKQLVSVKSNRFLWTLDAANGLNGLAVNSPNELPTNDFPNVAAISRQPLIDVGSPPANLRATVERLTFELAVKNAGNSVVKIADLGFAPEHPNFFGALPTDEQLYRFDERNCLKPPAIQVWRQTGDLFRFPLAGDDANADFYLPLAMPTLLEIFADAIAQTATRLERDGLAEFDERLFLDEKLLETSFGSLLKDAEFISYFAASPRLLNAIHAALVPETIVRATDANSSAKTVYNNLSLEEATIIAVPDAVHKGWIRAQPKLPAPPVVVPLKPVEPDFGTFQNCTEREAAKTLIEAEPKSDLPAKEWQSKTDEDFDDTVLLKVQRALLRMSAARGDLFAVLDLPQHYQQKQAAAHVARLKSQAVGETQILSFAAVYHPWLRQLESGDLRNVPPSGAAAGILAARAFRRGAWIAPANEILRGVLGLATRFDSTDFLDFQDSNINLVRHEPTGFTVLNSSTLSDDADWREISVRRLIGLLRRLAHKHGAEYVFEPHDERFRRAVERGFGQLLDYLFARGAFAGATAAQSYQVAVSETVNNRNSVDQGRFVAELRVAPSQPLKFLTVRLVQTGGRATVTESI